MGVHCTVYSVHCTGVWCDGMYVCMSVCVCVCCVCESERTHTGASVRHVRTWKTKLQSVRRKNGEKISCTSL